MEFEWDERKNRRNKNKHGIDFETAMKLWNDKNRIEIQTPFPIENSSILIGIIDKKLWSAIFTLRITLDIAEALVQDIDQIRESIGVDRAALIKIWLHERIQQEKAASSD